MNKIALSGIKPTGELHIGNYLGMIKPALDLANEYQALYFIADYHALTTVRDRKTMNQLVYDVAASLLALGLDAEKIVFFRQADVPEIFELTWILACFTSKGLLNRAHAYKSVVEANQAAGKLPDADINAGLYNYPVLMAADILLYGSNFVPVGQDQRQHVEIARDIAEAVNHNYGSIFTLPEPLIQKEVMTIPGIDGRKMSKNYNNTIPIFADPKTLRKQVMRIVTDSKRPEDSKNPDTCNVFGIYRYFAAPEAVEAKRRLYLKGGLAYSDIKEELYELLENKFGGSRKAYMKLLKDRGHLDAVLIRGAAKARAIGRPVMEKLRRKIGIR
ncbi:MAG: tryptophan--tRNA ligase [Desulfobacterales bacterium]